MDKPRLDQDMEPAARTPRPREEIFLLSVLPPWAAMLASGEKQWEFRANPNFGRAGEHTMRPGDRLFIIESGPEPHFLCHGLVSRILRGQEIEHYFTTPERLGEAGYPAAPESQARFREEILPGHATAVHIQASPLPRPVPVSLIRHLHKKTPFLGRGFYHVAQLGRYHAGGRPVAGYLKELSAGAGEPSA